MRTSACTEPKRRSPPVVIRERARIAPQPKLAIGAPGDRFEREADRVADTVMRGGSAAVTAAGPPSIQRACAACSEERETIRAAPQGSSLNASPHVAGAIAQARGGGAPLGGAARAFFEPRLGRDFGDVRVHDDANAHALAGSLGARAFTVGNHIFFDRGELAPSTPGGGRLLAHELTHVVQQRGAAPMLQMEKKPWGVSFTTQAQADKVARGLSGKGMTVYPSHKDGKQWTFDIEFLTKADAEAAAKAAADPRFAIEVRQDDHSKSWYVHKELKCPEGLPVKTGYQTWDACFGKEGEARKLVAKFKNAHIKAEVSDQQPNGQFGVYYAPLSKADATKAATAEIDKKRDKASGMYKANVTEAKDLKTYTYNIDASCPPGYTDLGTFRLTAYPLAIEKEFPAKPSVKDPCGLKGTYSEAFLTRSDPAPRGVTMEGTGIAKNGDIIHFEKFTGKGKDKTACFKKVPKIIGANNTELVPMKSVAVDPAVIPLGSELLVESWGSATADDTGGDVHGQHIDLYYGATITGKEADKLTFNDQRVCKKK